MKKLSFFLVLVLLLGLFVGCSNNQIADEEPLEDNNVEKPNTPVNVTIAGLKGPTSIGMIKLIDEKLLNSGEYNVEYIAESAPDALTGKIINGNVQISSVPINLASVLYNKTQGEVQIVALNTIGNLFIVGTDEISSINDLKGKTLGMSGKGATPDYAMNYILKQNNLADDVELDFAMDHATLAQTVIAEDTKVALLPQPFATQATLKNNNVKILIDLNEEWKKATNGEGELITGAIIVNKEFAQNNKEFVTEFLEQYKSSVEWVNEFPADASVLVEKHEIMPSATLVEKAIPYCGITFKLAADEKNSIDSFLKVLYDSNPTSVGGSLPDEAFYYSK